MPGSASVKRRSLIVERRIPFRTRPRGRSALQEEQSHASRQRILDAAERVFIENSYGASTVDDILKRAEVGRATFYRHFSSVFDVAKGLIEGFKPSIFAFYDELAALRSPTQAQVEDWIRRLLEIYRETRPFMVILLEVSGSEPEFFPILIELNRQYIDRLGVGIPAFRQASLDDPDSRSAAIGAQLLLQNLSAFCYMVVLRKWSVEESVAIRVVARDFIRFIEDYDNREIAMAPGVP